MSPKLENLIALLAKTSLNHHDFLQLAGDISEITSLFNPRDFDMWRFLRNRYLRRNFLHR